MGHQLARCHIYWIKNILGLDKRIHCLPVFSPMRRALSLFTFQHLNCSYHSSTLIRKQQNFQNQIDWTFWTVNSSRKQGHYDQNFQNNISKTKIFSYLHTIVTLYKAELTTTRSNTSMIQGCPTKILYISHHNIQGPRVLMKLKEKGIY